MSRSPFIRNEYGVWCPSCGELLALVENASFDSDGDCPTCGFPDDIEQMAEYHCGEQP